MATIYEEAAATALELITEFGTDANIRRVSKDYTPATGEAVELVKLAGTLKALILPIASTPKGVFIEADNKLIEDLIAGKLRFVLAAAKGATFEPVANDLIEIAGETFTVKGCTPLSPAGVPILYKMGVEVAPAAPTNADTLELGATEQAAGDLAGYSNG